jgi:hypothetical protein
MASRCRMSRPKPLAILGAFALTLCLSSCSGSFDVRPTGSIQQGIIFTFYKPDAPKPSRFRISRLFVEQHTAHGWKLVWSLDGARSLSAITYGTSYPGLNESRRAPQLVRGQLYRVAAGSDGLFGGADFLIDHTGAVVIRPPTI